MRLRAILLTVALGAAPLCARPPKPVDSWPTYNGDFSGRRFSPLAKVNDHNVSALSLAWMYREALNAATGEPLWHSRLASGVSTPPTTWELDGTRYLIVGAGDTLYAFTMLAK